MNHNAALQLIRVACDQWQHYNDATQRNLLAGIFWLADAVVEDLKSRADADDYEHAISEIQLIQDFSEYQNLSRAFSEIADCILRAIPLPPDEP